MIFLLIVIAGLLWAILAEVQQPQEASIDPNYVPLTTADKIVGFIIAIPVLIFFGALFAVLWML